MSDGVGYKEGYLRIKQKSFPKSKYPLHVRFYFSFFIFFELSPSLLSIMLMKILKVLSFSNNKNNIFRNNITYLLEGSYYWCTNQVITWKMFEVRMLAYNSPIVILWIVFYLFFIFYLFLGKLTWFLRVLSIIYKGHYIVDELYETNGP